MDCNKHDTVLTLSTPPNPKGGASKKTHLRSDGSNQKLSPPQGRGPRPQALPFIIPDARSDNRRSATNPVKERQHRGERLNLYFSSSRSRSSGSTLTSVHHLRHQVRLRHRRAGPLSLDRTPALATAPLGMELPGPFDEWRSQPFSVFVATLLGIAHNSMCTRPSDNLVPCHKPGTGAALRPSQLDPAQGVISHLCVPHQT